MCARCSTAGKLEGTGYCVGEGVCGIFPRLKTVTRPVARVFKKTWGVEHNEAAPPAKYPPQSRV